MEKRGGAGEHLIGVAKTRESIMGWNVCEGRKIKDPSTPNLTHTQC